MVYHHPDKFGDRRQSDSGDLMISICLVTSCIHMFKSYVTLWAEAPHGKSQTFHAWWLLV